MKIYLKKMLNRIEWIELDDNGDGEWLALVNRPERTNTSERQIMFYNRVKNPDTSEYNKITREQLREELCDMHQIVKVENYEHE
jgi:hypothetical protein